MVWGPFPRPVTPVPTAVCGEASLRESKGQQEYLDLVTGLVVCWPAPKQFQMASSGNPPEMLGMNSWTCTCDCI